MKNIFRKESLERLASPEQIDRLLVIIRLPGWIALLCTFVLIIIIFLYSIFGQIPVTADGRGIFFDPKGIVLIQSDLEGYVDEVNVQEGEKVKKGSQLLLLKNPNKSLEYRELLIEIQETEETIAWEKQIAIEKLTISLKHHHAVYDLQKKRMEEITDEQELYELKIEMLKQEGAIALLKEQITHPDFIEPIDSHIWKLLELHQKEQISKAELENMIVRAPADGTVVIIEAMQRREVKPGSTLIWFEKEKEEMELVYGFFSIEEGHQIKPGMKAHIEFTSVNSELYGKMEGVVKRVLPFAATTKGYILQSIPSEQLRNFLTKNDVAVTVEIEPLLDPNTPSGYKWTTAKGPPFSIHRGSVSDVHVLLEKRRPITYLIPIKVDHE